MKDPSTFGIKVVEPGEVLPSPIEAKTTYMWSNFGEGRQRTIHRIELIFVGYSYCDLNISSSDPKRSLSGPYSMN